MFFKYEITIINITFRRKMFFYRNYEYSVSQMLCFIHITLVSLIVEIAVMTKCCNIYKYLRHKEHNRQYLFEKSLFC